MSDQQEFKSGLAESALASGSGDRFRDFVAIQDVPPQKTLFLSVSGQVLVGNPGIVVELEYAIPQGINPKILLLKVTLVQRPGIWPQVLSWKPANYGSGPISYNQYTHVQLDLGGSSFTIPVIDRV